MSSKTPTIAACMTPSPTCISVDRSLSDARAMMAEGDFRHLPVVKGEEVVGILSDRDIAVVQGLREVDVQRFRVEDAMVPCPYSVGPEAPLREVVHEMEQWRYGAALVMDGGRLVGVFTTVDALRVLAGLLDGKPAERRRIGAHAHMR